MKVIKQTLLILNCCFFLNTTAQKIIDTIAVKAGGYDIPIRIKLPKKTIGKSPVYFFVHGGGWNGGDQKEVPPATISGDANFLVNELGVIYVGLAYRCKGNNATFADAINDLEASVQWFFDNADAFNADITRIGFGGASAGSTLSAVMAQKYPNCKVYIGAEGMYNLVDHDEKQSPFPNSEARKIYGLDTKEKSKIASAFYNLKENPPTSLLLHGKEDRLCHFTQSIKFADKIREAGGKAKVILYDSINHTCLAAIYPDVFKKSVLEIAALFIEEFQLKNKNLDTIKLALDKQLENQYPLINLTEDKIIGSWKFKNELLIFKENGKGEQKMNMNTIEFVYKIENDSIKITSNNQDVRLFFLRKSKNIMYELLTQNKENKYRQLNFLKQ
ncbi:alpha/beta hydrolase fold domain-containing protein [Polaribacter sp.]|jgi:acetyl esterase/lipase|uniref:alpha/beta hydrolase fold domain-containing protein n=1 Tax=Polaribacter sp. TaxID=1920175 RepID=UPI004048E91D